MSRKLSGLPFFMAVAIVSAIWGGVSGMFGASGSSSSGTKGMPNVGRSHRTRAKAPNDGRWHMKHHRGRH